MSNRTLAMLNKLESGVVASISGNDEKLKHRLIDMGITPGVRITLEHVAPMGDPLEITVRGYTLSLRHADAENIVLVEKDNEESFLDSLKKRRDKLIKSAKAELETFAKLDISDKATRKEAVKLTEFLTDDCDINSDCPKCSKNFISKSIKHDDQTAEKDPIHIALAGNPNCGKTTLFNALTGAREYVGNWPGVTVEKKEGRIISAKRCESEEGYCTHGHPMVLVDLPGIYSLSPHSMEEIIARRFIIEESPAAIINIVDATNLEHNLYLSVQLLELGVPMVIALNMMDEVEKRGDTIDHIELSKRLGVPIVAISAKTGKGVDALVASAQKLINAAHIQHHLGYNVEPDIFYDDFTHVMHHKIGNIIAPYAEKAKLPLHFCEIKLMERDSLVIEALNMPTDVMQRVERIIDEYSKKLGFEDTETLIADSRYAFIENAVAASYIRSEKSRSISAKIDKIVTNKFLALPIFVLIMMLIFSLTFSTVGAFLSDVFEVLIANFTDVLRTGLEGISVAPWLINLICDGIIAGVGGVLTFLPQIAILFFMLSLLEDSGYMARIAFIMDKPMRKIGLSGKSIIPLLMGFGCTVPAAMGSRALENENDKRMTILLLPFMSCSAKLPVYALIAGAFFSKGNALVVFALYLIGILSGIVSGALFKKTIFKSKESQFLIELPPYRMPTTKATLIHVWERVKHFLVKAGTIILLMSVVLWFLMSFTFGLQMTDDPSQSIIGVIGSIIAPIFTPTGFPYWQAAVALIVGIVAKEAVVSSLAMFYGFAEGAGAGKVFEILSQDFTTASAFSFLVFVLLYVPCFAAITTMKAELRSTKHWLFSIAFQLVFAYVASTIAYAAFNLLS